MNQPTQESAGVAPGRAFGKYQLVAEIGRGGMGIVFRAWDKTLKRTVALKMLVAGDTASPEEEERLYKEATANARLSHPNILPVYEVGRVDGRLYFTMEFIKGKGFDILCKAGEIDLRRGLEILAIVARALDHAHKKGIIHRDVKPSNVMIDTTGHVFLMDFGLARNFRETGKLTQTGFVMGTPAYMSPEQCRGEREGLDGRSDVFGLGTVMYEFLCGRTPFESENVLDVLMSVLKVDPAPPGMMVPDLPPDVETICMKAMRKERDDRYAHAADMADDIDRYLRGEAIAALPETRLQRLKVRIRRNRKAFAASAAGVVLLLVSAGFGLSAWKSSLESQHERDVQAKANAAREKARTSFSAAKDEVATAEKCLVTGRTADLPPHLDAAAQKLDEALAADATFAEALALRAKVRNLQGRRDLALADADEALKRDANLVDARYERAKVRIAALSDMIVGSAGREEAGRKGGAEMAGMAKVDLDAVIAAQPAPKEETLLHCRAAKAFLDGHRAEAIAGLAEAVRKNPFLDDALFLRGYLLFKDGNLEGARKDFDEAVKVNPLNVNALNHQGMALGNAGKLADAAACYAAALKVDPKFRWARLNLGIAHVGLQQWAQARDELTAILQEEPDEVRALENRGEALARLGDAAGAIADATKWLGLEPDSVRAFVARAQARNLAQDWKGAAADAEEALKRDAKSVDALIEHALAAEELADRPRAIADYDQVLALEAANVEALWNRGRLHAEAGRKDEARADLEAFVKNAPADHPKVAEAKQALEKLGEGK